MKKRPEPHNKETKRVGNEVETIEVSSSGVMRKSGRMAGRPIPFNTKVSVNGVLLYTKDRSNSVDILGFDPKRPDFLLWERQKVARGIHTPTDSDLMPGRHDEPTITGNEKPDSDGSMFYQLLVAHGVDERTSDTHAWHFDGLGKGLHQFRAICKVVCRIGENKEDLGEVVLGLTYCISIEEVCNVLAIPRKSLGSLNGREAELLGDVISLAEVVIDAVF